jgi:CheY-like chemotaxis protein
MTKILFVEDHPDIRHVVRIQLERRGFVVMIATNGKEGVETAIAAKPDLILMNCRMPEMDGRQGMRIIRATPETKNIPILSATAMFQPSDIQLCIDASCTDYIVKPFTFLELQRKINTLLDYNRT